MDISEINNQKITWVRGATIGNGCCSYHALAEVFLRIVRNQPEFLNPALFEEDNPVFQPVQDFFTHTLGLEKPFSLEKLRQTFLNLPRETETVVTSIAPAMLILAVSYYRAILKPVLTRYNQIKQNTPQNDSQSYMEYLDNICKETLTSLNFQDKSIAKESCQEDKDYSLHQLHSDCTGTSEISQIIELMSRNNHNPAVRDFLAQDCATPLNSEQAQDFINLIAKGIPAAQYATEDILSKLIRLLCLPSRRGENYAFVYPCALSLHGLESYTTELNQQEQPYLINCINNAHFEYSFASFLTDKFNEQPSLPLRRATPAFLDQASFMPSEPLEEISNTSFIIISGLVIAGGIVLGIFFPLFTLSLIAAGFFKYCYDTFYSAGEDIEVTDFTHSNSKDENLSETKPVYKNNDLYFSSRSSENETSAAPKTSCEHHIHVARSKK